MRIGYVSVGFPLPEANFNQLHCCRYNHEGSNFVLKSRNTGYPYPGHYLTARENGNLTVLKLPTFDEEIVVYVKEGRAEDRPQILPGGSKLPDAVLLYGESRRGRLSFLDL